MSDRSGTQRLVPKFLDLTGQRFGQLVAIRRIDTARPSRWVVVCDCGNTSDVATGHLTSGAQKTCGCSKKTQAARDRIGIRSTIHGHARVGLITPTFKSWSSMIARCQCKTDEHCSSYGGRGIKICERWQLFENFLIDMGERPKNKTIDRYPNVDGDYEPGNCRWATSAQQAQNRRGMLSIDTVQEIHGRHEHGESIKSIASRLNKRYGAIRRIVKGERWPTFK